MIDTHCHIHDDQYDFDLPGVLLRADQAGVKQLICIGTDSKTSKAALALANKEANCYASAALHPHEATAPLASLKTAFGQIASLVQSAGPKLVAVGECGLDYYYHHQKSIRHRQQVILGWHLELASSSNLPVIFHIREAWSDFWPIYDQFQLPGVIHSFSATKEALNQILERPKLLVGVNGLATFASQAQQAAIAAIPLNRLVLETDAPFLTPAPFRGKMNEPSYLEYVVRHLAELRSQSRSAIVAHTNRNSRQLFKNMRRNHG